MKPDDLIVRARRRAGPSKRGKPRQSDLRRAASTARYALFRTLCQVCADCFVGTASADRSRPASRQVCRSVEHGPAKERFRKAEVMRRFPREIEDIGNLFVQLREKRHAADCDPVWSAARSDVLSDVDAADQALRALRKVAMKDRRAVAAWALLRDRRA